MRVVTLFISLLIVVVVSAQKEDDLNCEVRPVNSKLTIKGNQLFYSLPMNTIRIALEVEKVTQFEGPYREFAAKYLNITDGVIQGDDEYYVIVSAKMERLSQPDSSHFYSVTCGGFSGFPMLQLNSDGVILGCNLANPIDGYSTKVDALILPEPEPEDYFFTDLGIKPFVFEKSTTLYKVVATDSTPTKVAYEQGVKTQTTDEMNAEAAANFIRKLRKRRLKLITGDKEEVINLDGLAIGNMVEDLKTLEDEYVSLFVGKTIKKKYIYNFEFTPDETDGDEQQIVGWFSRNKGLIFGKPEVRRTDYSPLVVHSEIKGKMPKTQIQMMDQTQKSPTPIKYGLYYRVPGHINFSLKLLDQVLMQQEWEIAQKGRVLPLPVTYLNDQSYAVEFYPETGSIKRIFRTK